MSQRIPPLTRCRLCRCTQMEPCSPPCAWWPGEEDLCDSCAAVAAVVRAWWAEGAHRPSWAALRRELQRPGLVVEGAAEMRALFVKPIAPRQRSRRKESTKA